MILPPVGAPRFAFYQWYGCKPHLYGREFPTPEIEALLSLVPNVRWQWDNGRRQMRVMYIGIEMRSAIIDGSPETVFSLEEWQRAVAIAMGVAQ